MASYYNEFDPNAAAWLRQLIADKQIPYGHVDDRSITEVTPSDLKGYVQCHWFAGIAGWPLALRLAGWPDDRPVWTASLPCQPFSSAGKQAGTDDERHLWPVFQRLVSECRPPAIFGEQVASKIAREKWFPGVCLDLQAMGYPVTALDLCAPCAGEDGEGRTHRGDIEPIVIGAPHIRQRLYWVAYRGVADTHSVHESRNARSGDEGIGTGEDLGGGMHEAIGDGAQSDSGMADTELYGHAATERPRDISGVEQHPRRQGQSEGANHLQQSQAAGGDEPLQPGDEAGRTPDHRMAQPRNVGAGSQPRQACGLGEQSVDTGAAGLRQDHGTACPGGVDPRGAGCDADSRMDNTPSGGLQGALCGEIRSEREDRAGEESATPRPGASDSWKLVSFAADCLGGDDETGEPGDECSICGLTYAEDCECPGPTHDGYEYDERDGVLYARWAGDTGSEGSQGLAGDVGDGSEPGRQHQEQARPAWAASWTDFDLIPCRDGKARRSQRSVAALAPRLPRGVVPSCDPGAPGYANETSEARVMRLKGYGNAICAPLAAMFIETCMEVIPHE